jgi:hypothetical protein
MGSVVFQGKNVRLISSLDVFNSFSLTSSELICLMYNIVIFFFGL